MRRRGHAATDHAEVADDAPCCAVCRDASPPCECEQLDAAWLARQMEILARNLRDAAALEFAARLERHYNDDLHGWGDGETPWTSNLDGRAAPGWER